MNSLEEIAAEHNIKLDGRLEAVIVTNEVTSDLGLSSDEKTLVIKTDNNIPVGKYLV